MISKHSSDSLFRWVDENPHAELYGSPKLITLDDDDPCWELFYYLGNDYAGGYYLGAKPKPPSKNRYYQYARTKIFRSSTGDRKTLVGHCEGDGDYIVIDTHGDDLVYRWSLQSGNDFDIISRASHDLNAVHWADAVAQTTIPYAIGLKIATSEGVCVPHLQMGFATEENYFAYRMGS